MRGQGIGRSLLDVLLAEAASADVERVTVHSSETAVPLYMRAGFASTTRLMDVAFGS
jgi:ribosomal protein S18 acetylase RimI-like enzyme